MKNILISISLLMLVITSCEKSNQSVRNNSISNTGCIGGPTTVTDIDGNIYNIVSVGNQCWMKENLKTAHYRNGMQIPNVKNSSQWQNNSSGACADINNDSVNTADYGKLYNWYAVVNSAGLCPTGWHVPNDSEFNLLIKNVDINSDTSCYSCNQSLTAGGAMKEIGLTHWASPNTGANNKSNFTALPCGFRNVAGPFYQFGQSATFWSSTESPQFSLTNANLRILYHDATSVYFPGGFDKNFGLSIRCLRD